MKIRCPKCRWEPDASARWGCSCGHQWNTFDTNGQCPACGRVWRDTQCLACRRWSKHHDWYEDLPPVDVDAVLEPAERGIPAESSFR